MQYGDARHSGIEMDQLFRHLVPVADALGTPHFEKNLATALGSLLAHDMMTMTRYSALGAPTFLIHTHNFPAQMAERYLTIYHLFDPFLDHWREKEQPGVIWLGDLSPSKRKVERYVKEFLADSGIKDEVGFFLPAVGRESVAFFYENSQRRYTTSEIGLLNAVFAFAASLYRTHIRYLIHGFGDAENSPSLGRPLRITDARGETIWQTSLWQRHAGKLEEEIAASPKDPDEKTTVRLSDGNLLLREPLGPEFAGKAGNYIWAIEEVSQSRPISMSNEFQVGNWDFDSVLTARECDIVELILKGHPTAGIANLLRLSPGTVKNHRRRIYAKLDITTERELFVMYMNALVPSQIT